MAKMVVMPPIAMGMCGSQGLGAGQRHFQLTDENGYGSRDGSQTFFE